MSSKKELSENSIYTHFVIPALTKVGWNLQNQIRENVYFTDGRI
jgi:type I restriction enzyme R subunit